MTLSETQILIEKGISIGGKPVKHHIEALDLYAATQAMRAMAAKDWSASGNTVLALHQMVVARSIPQIAGR